VTADPHLRAATDRLARGDKDGAARECEAALRISPDCLPAHRMLAEIALPGPPYTDVLATIHAQVRPRSYLEIGVASGKTIVLAAPDTRAVGVDPDPKIARALGRNVQIVKATSDDFFAQHDINALFMGARIELAFIDGMHHFEFALRDFAAVERLAERRSIILLHDCYPLDRPTAERVRRTVFWSGDCWRLILALKKHRPDLAIDTIATAPTGLAVVRNLDPASSVLHERMDEIVAEFLALDYGVLERDKPGMLNLLPNDPARISALLAGA
jgi:SAM-dependent methyltransferase